MLLPPTLLQLEIPHINTTTYHPPTTTHPPPLYRTILPLLLLLLQLHSQTTSTVATTEDRYHTLLPLLWSPISQYSIAIAIPDLPWTKWPPLCRRWIQIYFSEWRVFPLIKISLKFVPNGPIDNKPAFVSIMAWRRIGDKTLSSQMLTLFTDAYMRH